MGTLPTNRIKKIKLPGDNNGDKTYDIIPTMLQDGTTTNKLSVPSLSTDDTIVTTNTTQTISGNKTFTGTIYTSYSSGTNHGYIYSSNNVMNVHTTTGDITIDACNDVNIYSDTTGEVNIQNGHIIIPKSTSTGITQITFKDFNRETISSNTIYNPTYTFPKLLDNDSHIIATTDQIATNIQNGSGTGAVQEIQDGTGGTFDFTNKNPNATALDSSLTGNITYGGVGNYSASFGGKSQASGKRSVAQGTTTVAKGNYSHAEGDNSVSLGADSHAEGYQTVSYGGASHAEGTSTQALGNNSHAEGNSTIARAVNSHAEGYNSQTLISDSSRPNIPAYSDQQGGGGSDPGQGGTSTAQTGDGAHVEGSNTRAVGNYSHAEGTNTWAGGLSSHAEGYGSQALYDYAHAEGYNSVASGYGAHATGVHTVASGNYSFTQGQQTTASANTAVAFGKGTTADWESLTTVGKYNSTTYKINGTPLFTVGNGTADNARSNAFVVYADGSAEVNGKTIATTDDLTGFITGPSSATDKDLAIFDGSSGKLIKAFGINCTTSSGSGGSDPQYTLTARNAYHFNLKAHSAGIAIDRVNNGTIKSISVVPIKASSTDSKYLGSSSERWTTVYTDQLSDGTNSTAIENIVTKTGTQSITGTKTFTTSGSLNTNVIISGGYGNQSGYEADAIGGLMFTGAASGMYGKATLLLAHASGSSSTSSPVQVYLPNKTGTLAVTTDIPSNQETMTVVGDALTNINGRTLSSYEATLTASTYTYYTITYGGAKCTEEQARNYMEYMTGSRYLPQYDYEKPKNSIFMFSDRTFWKPQYDSTNGLQLYRLSTALALEKYSHNMRVSATGSGGSGSSSTSFSFKIITGSNTALTYTTLAGALYNAGFTSSTSYCPASGIYTVNASGAQTTGIVTGVYSTSSSASTIYVAYYTIASTSTTTMTVNSTSNTTNTASFTLTSAGTVDMVREIC